jgi:hypothetical protein
MKDSDLTERMITAAEFAAILRVTEDDVLQWMLARQIPYVDGVDGEPRARIREEHSVDGPFTDWSITYSMSQDSDFQAEVALRRRELELETMDSGVVDLEALSHALGSRFQAVAPSACRLTVDGARIWLRDARGAGGGIDVAFAASLPESGSGAERVRHAAAIALQQAQDQLAELTTDPWPCKGPGHLPVPRAELILEGTAVRLLYGDLADPVLELEPLQVSEVLSSPDS